MKKIRFFHLQAGEILLLVLEFSTKSLNASMGLNEEKAIFCHGRDGR